MTHDYTEDRARADRFTPLICEIIGPKLLCAAPEREDMKEATDLILLNARDLRIGCRVRRWGVAQKWPNQFTVRYARPCGIETEYDKLKNGFGDWLFYGHADEHDTAIASWMIVDLKSWRSHLMAHEDVRRRISKTIIPNRDGTKFIAFDVTTFPPKPPILVARSVGCLTARDDPPPYTDDDCPLDMVPA